MPVISFVHRQTIIVFTTDMLPEYIAAIRLEEHSIDNSFRPFGSSHDAF